MPFKVTLLGVSDEPTVNPARFVELPTALNVTAPVVSTSSEFAPLIVELNSTLPPPEDVNVELPVRVTAPVKV